MTSPSRSRLAASSSRQDQRSRRYALRAVQPSPARAEPHDATAWLPLPELSDLPTIEELIGPERAASIAHAVTEPRKSQVRPRPERPKPLVRPSPARSAPHDPDAWFPVLAFEELLDDDFLVTSGQTEAVESSVSGSVPTLAPLARPRRERRGTRAGTRPWVKVARQRRAIVIALAVATTAAAGVAVPRLLAAESAPEVQLTVDGETRAVESDADTVGDLLSDENIEVAPDDRVEPAPTTEVEDGLAVQVFRAFDVHVDFDGEVRTVRTTFTTADQLLDELGLDPEVVGVRLAPDRLGAGATVVFRTFKATTITVDGTTQDERSLALTVGELLGDNAVELGPQDVVEPPMDTVLTDGMAVAVTRISTDETSQTEEAIPYPVERREDPSLPKGEEQTIQAGVPGVQVVTYRHTKADGREIAKEPISKVPITPPVPEIVVVGTALPNQRVGTASWYASPFGSDSCATKEYVPKGTIVIVTNLDTGASTTCRVADRVEAARVVDLDDDVFRQLAPLGQGVFNARIDW